MKSNTRKKRAISKLLTLLTLGTVGASVQLPSTLAVLEDKSTAANQPASENAVQLGQGDVNQNNLAGYLCYSDVQVSTTESCEKKATAGTNAKERKAELLGRKTALRLKMNSCETMGLWPVASDHKTYVITTGNMTAPQLFQAFQTTTEVGENLKEEYDVWTKNALWLRGVVCKKEDKPPAGLYQLVIDTKGNYVEKVTSVEQALGLGLLTLHVPSGGVEDALKNPVVLKENGDAGTENDVGAYIVPKGFDHLEKDLWKALQPILKPIATAAVPANEILRTGLDPTGITGKEKELTKKDFNPRLRIVKATTPPANTEEGNPQRATKLMENLEKLDSAFDTLVVDFPTKYTRTKSYKIKMAKLALKALMTLNLEPDAGKSMYKLLSKGDTLKTVESIAKYVAGELVMNVADSVVEGGPGYAGEIQRLKALDQYAGDATILKADDLGTQIADNAKKLADANNKLKAWADLAPNTPEHNAAYNVIKRDKYDGKDMQQIETAGKDKYVGAYKTNSGGKTPEEVYAEAQQLKDSQIGIGTKIAALGATAAFSFGGGTLMGKLFGKPPKSSGVKDSMTRDNKPANAPRAGGKQANAKAATK